MSLLVQVIKISKTEFKINLTEKMQAAFSGIITKKIKPLELYAITKFVCLCDKKEQLLLLISKQNQATDIDYKLDLSK